MRLVSFKKENNKYIINFTFDEEPLTLRYGKRYVLQLVKEILLLARDGKLIVPPGQSLCIRRGVGQEITVESDSKIERIRELLFKKEDEVDNKIITRGSLSDMATSYFRGINFNSVKDIKLLEEILKNIPFDDQLFIDLLIDAVINSSPAAVQLMVGIINHKKIVISDYYKNKLRQIVNDKFSSSSNDKLIIIIFQLEKVGVKIPYNDIPGNSHNSRVNTLYMLHQMLTGSLSQKDMVAESYYKGKIFFNLGDMLKISFLNGMYNYPEYRNKIVSIMIELGMVNVLANIIFSYLDFSEEYVPFFPKSYERNISFGTGLVSILTDFIHSINAKRSGSERSIMSWFGWRSDEEPIISTDEFKITSNLDLSSINGDSETLLNLVQRLYRFFDNNNDIPSKRVVASYLEGIIRNIQQEMKEKSNNSPLVGLRSFDMFSDYIKWQIVFVILSLPSEEQAVFSVDIIELLFSNSEDEFTINWVKEYFSKYVPLLPKNDRLNQYSVPLLQQETNYLQQLKFKILSSKEYKLQPQKKMDLNRVTDDDGLKNWLKDNWNKPCHKRLTEVLNRSNNKKLAQYYQDNYQQVFSETVTDEYLPTDVSKDGDSKNDDSKDGDSNLSMIDSFKKAIFSLAAELKLQGDESRVLSGVFTREALVEWLKANWTSGRHGILNDSSVLVTSVQDFYVVVHESAFPDGQIDEDLRVAPRAVTTGVTFSTSEETTAVPVVEEQKESTKGKICLTPHLEGSYTASHSLSGDAHVHRKINKLKYMIRNLETNKIMLLSGAVTSLNSLKNLENVRKWLEKNMHSIEEEYGNKQSSGYLTSAMLTAATSTMEDLRLFANNMQIVSSGQSAASTSM